MSKKKSVCDKFCPPTVEAPVAKGAGPSPQTPHLPNAKNPITGNKYRTDYLAWVRFPNAPYPPGGTPSGGAQELSISSEEWARRAKQSPCYKCQLHQQVIEASKLKLNWMFWTGLGAGALGIGMLVVLKNR